MRGTIALLLTIVAITGCAQDRQHDQPQGPLLEALLPPDSLGRSLSLSQIVEGRFENRVETMHIEVEATPERLVMVAMTPLGVPLFTLEQTANRINVTGLAAKQLPFDPRYILSDFQIAYWPPATLGYSLSAVGLQIVGRGEPKRRQILGPGDELLLEITYHEEPSRDGALTIEHFDHPYSLHVKPIKSLEARHHE